MEHIGSLIKKVLKENGMTVSEFARRINTNRNNIYDIFLRESIDTSLLKKISDTLQHDFFKYLNSAYSIKETINYVNEPEATYIINNVTYLQKEVKQLQNENMILKNWLEDKGKIIEMLQNKILELNIK